jgi:DNA-binding beta-propeller fold protein YncE
MRLPRSTAIALAAVFAVSACSAKAKPHSAAEPAVAPSGTAAPAGTVVMTGADPEGIVYDVKTGLLAVAVRSPDRLLILNAATMAVTHTVVLPGHARHLQLAGPGGPVLVPAEDSNTLVQVSLPDGVATKTKVGVEPHDASAVSGDQIVVGDEFGQSLTVLHNTTVERTIRGVQQPGGVIGDGSKVVVVDVRAYTVSSFDVASGRRTAITSAGKGPTHGVMLAGQRLAVADTRGNALLIYSLMPLKMISHLALAGKPYGIAIDNSTGIVWVTLTALNEVVGVQTGAGKPKIIARYATVEQPNTVAVDPGSHRLWITGTRNGQLEVISR